LSSFLWDDDHNALAGDVQMNRRMTLIGAVAGWFSAVFTKFQRDAKRRLAQNVLWSFRIPTT
jgi:hypothetical protein